MKKLLSAISALLIMAISEANAHDLSALPPDFSKISTRLDKISSRLGSGKADNKQISDYLQEVTIFKPAFCKHEANSARN